MANIYFVKHPYSEPDYGIAGIGDKVHVLWTTNQHRRKFIKRHGECLDANLKCIASNNLYFWGEYEPYSLAHIIRSKGTPMAIHEDLKSMAIYIDYPIPSAMIGTFYHNGLNTDPYVFGERFRYICCQKPATLNKGDVVIFGNEIIDKQKRTDYFYFDTVFVCKEDKVAVTKASDPQYFIVGMNDGRLRKLPAEGYMFNDKFMVGNDHLFSFVPCLPDNSTEINSELASSFNKPYIDLKVFDRQSFSHRRTIRSVPFSSRLWHEITKAIKSPLCFGTQIDKI